MRTTTRNRFGDGRALWASTVGLCLLSLVFVGSPGCGCGDTLPAATPPPPCCCDFTWIPEADIGAATVNIVITSVSGGLDPSILPATLTGVDYQEPVSFSVCVSQDHALGASLALEFRDAGSNALYGSAVLTYRLRCTPVILEGDRTTLFSPDCGSTPRCCCTFEWFNTVTAGPIVDIRVELVGADASLAPTANPSLFPNVAPGQVLLIEVCVDIDHVIGAGMQIRLVDDETNEVISTLPLSYEGRCYPVSGDPSGQGFWNNLCEPQIPR